MKFICSWVCFFLFSVTQRWSGQRKDGLIDNLHKVVLRPYGNRRWSDEGMMLYCPVFILVHLCFLCFNSISSTRRITEVLPLKAELSISTPESLGLRVWSVPHTPEPLTDLLACFVMCTAYCERFCSAFHLSVRQSVWVVMLWQLKPWIHFGLVFPWVCSARFITNHG